MILKFPKLDVLSLCLSSGTVSPEISAQTSIVGVQPDGVVWLTFEHSVTQLVLKQLRQFGVSTARTFPDRDVTARMISHWWEAIPVQKFANIAVNERSQVIFDIADPAQLSELVNEMLRQGNDRQSVLCVSGAETRTLLKVVGPPYFTLLKALHENPNDSSIKAFVESPSRVWTELGYKHPFAEKLLPADNQHLFIHADSTWHYLGEEPFQDLYALLEYQLPGGSVTATATNIETRFSVPIKLQRCTSADELPELWVLDHSGPKALEAFVGNSSDSLLQRLSFAVADLDHEQYVLVRIRPSRMSSPVLPFDGIGTPYRTILKIQNLFVPMGRKLHPPLRRDVIRKALAPDDASFVWLQPAGVDGFLPRMISERAFQPLSDWVDYVLDQHQTQLSAWVKSSQFDFESYVCSDGNPEKSKPDKGKDQGQLSNTPKRMQQEAPIKTDVDLTRQTASDMLKSLKKPTGKPTGTTDQPDANREQLAAELKTTENVFLELQAPLDAEARYKIWEKLTSLNESLKHYQEAAVCQAHLLWQQAEPSTSDLRLWLQTHIRMGGKQHSITNTEHKITDQEVAKLLNKPSPLPIEIAQLAAYVTWQAATDHASEYLLKHLGELQRYFEKNELYISVRMVWMTWLALSKLAGGDTLILARSRDRILERLFQHGLAVDLELPAFLRTAGSPRAERFREVKDRFVALREIVQVWSRANLGLSSTTTFAYVDLIFAYGLARFGEKTAALGLLDSASQQLSTYRNDDVHHWLRQAYKHRIREALEGNPNTNPLPADLLEFLESMSKLDRYKVDRLRQHSSIIEPHEKMDPYHSWKRNADDNLKEELARLFDVLNRNQLLKQINALFKQAALDAEQALVLTTALELSPRLEEKQATEWLMLVDPILRKTNDPVLQATLLERAMMIAAHYGQSSEAARLFQRLRHIVTSPGKMNLKTMAAIESMLSQSFRVLRRLGMRDELAQLLEDLSNLVYSTSKTHKNDPECLKLMLQLAGGWFYFGDDRGWNDINYVRDLLYSNIISKDGQIGSKIQTDLAIAYITAVGQAPLEESIQRLEELFENLTGIHDSNSVNSHYSLKQIDIVETFVQTVVNDDFSIDKSTLRWLDEEEFLIRRRIHHDMEAAMEGQ